MLSLKLFFPSALCLAIISPFIISCTSRDSGKSSRVLIDGSPIQCSSRNTYSDELTITELEIVDSGNVGKYPLEGRCEEEDKLITVTVNGYKTEKTPKCDRGRWEINLDLTEVITEGNTVAFHATHNRGRLCKEARVAFRGPKNYIPISASDDYDESSFYVMKYEAKLEGEKTASKAVSEPTGYPISRITHQEALLLCQNNGSRYELMKNSQWQTIVRAIEDENKNWSQGHHSPSDNNTLNCGIARGIPQEASSNDSNDCATTFCDSNWDINRRTHFLPNGKKIWDMCGNVGEMMKNRYNENDSFKGYVYQLSSDLKKLFGPKKTYSIVNASRRSTTWNLGYADIDRGNDLIIRGLPGRDAGIFSVNITSDQVSRRGSGHDVGFRCVYTP